MIRLLVVDDHAAMREALCMLLSFHDEVDIVANVGSGSEALATATEVEIDVIVMDLRMPGMDGLETTREMRARGVGIPVILHSAYSDESLIEEALGIADTSFVIKDAPRGELLDAIRSAASTIADPEIGSARW
jgi:DNA-binding NarL/FixJ family response regulator